MRIRALALAALMVIPCGLAMAQEQVRTPPALLLVDPRVILDQSRVGQSVIEQNQMDRARLQAEADAISQAFEQEERELAARRPLLTRDAFAELASDFDRRVRAARTEQDRRSQDLIQTIEARERAFAERLNPIYGMILNEVGAGAVVDVRNVIIANSRLDITQEVIARLDASLVDPER